MRVKDIATISMFYESNALGLEYAQINSFLPFLKWPWLGGLKIYIFTALLRKS